MIRSLIGDFDADALLKIAVQKTRLEDYGDPAFEFPFRLLIQALNQEASLSVIGRLVAWADLLRLLENRLHLIRDRQIFPEIAHQTIERPIFILGLPRTGSSFLHNLLAQDSHSRAPHYWETLYPSPPPGPDPDQRRITKANRDFRWFHRLNPKYKRIYQYGAQQAAECIALMATSFESLRFVFTYRVPTYWQWAQTQSFREGYRSLKAFLQQLQVHRPRTRWVLKAPAHLLHLETLLEVYPDAAVIFTHRHPFSAIASMASNTVSLRQAFCRVVDPQEVGQEELSRWRTGWERATAVRQCWPNHLPPYFDLQYEALVQRPMEAIEAIYRHFQMPLAGASRMQMRRFIAEHPKDAHGKHAYELDHFGLSQGSIQREFASYLEQFEL